MLPEEFYAIQQYLIQAFYPWIELWLVVFLVGAILVPLLIVVLQLIRVGLARFG